jgi:flagellar motor switch/type III secretory pathway protein FliN
MLGAWSASWLADGILSVVAVRREPLRQLSAGHMRASAGALVIDLSGRGKRVLLEAALGCGLEMLDLQADDHLLLDRFAAALAEELGARIDQGLGSPAGAPSTQVTLAIASREVATVDIPVTGLARAIKAAGTRRTSRRSLASRAAAVERIELPIEAVLGCARLSVNEIGTIAVGDVLLLDVEPPAVAALRIAGQARPFARAACERFDALAAVRLLKN